MHDSKVEVLMTFSANENSTGNTSAKIDLASRVASTLFKELKLDSKAHYYLAYSGGADSSVLLHCMTRLRAHYGFELTALHVSHNLQSASSTWAEHCAQVCESLDVPFKQVSLNLDSGSEASARTARYHWFSEQVERGSILMTAHHQQDRAETFLFNLMRGAGSTGLSSLRSKRPFHGATLVRPMLNQTLSDILGYAKQNRLKWVEDPSNTDEQYSRNEIRHQVLPSLESFRGDAIQNIARAAANLEQENNLLKEIAICDLVEVREHPKHPLDQSYALCVADLAHLSPARQGNLLRFWLRSLDLHSPSRQFLAKLLFAINEPPTSTAVLQEAGQQFRFYKGFMYVMPASETEPAFATINWQNPEKSVDLFHNKLRVDSTAKLRDFVLNERAASLKLAARAELINPKALQGHSLNLKKWMQDIGVPPWRRQAVPLLTVSKPGQDVVLAPVDQQIQTEWVSLECPI